MASSPRLNYSLCNRFRVSHMLPKQLQEEQVSLPAVLRTAGLPDGLFRQEKVLLTTEQLFALWQAIADVSGDPGIGLKLKQKEPADRSSPQTIAALSSESYLDAVQRAARFKKLTCPQEIRLRSSASESAIEFAFTLGQAKEPPALVDACLAWIWNVGRRGTGVPITPLRVELTRSPVHRRFLEEHYGCPVKFGCSRNALVMKPSDLQRPFVTRHPELLAMLSRQFETELSAQQSRQDIQDDVKTVLNYMLSGREPSISDVARTLGMSSRTLQRALAASGVTFQHLLREARHKLARHYLTQTTLELSETAFLLGFNDANSFFRAFRRWEGVSPHRWRLSRQVQMHLESRPEAASPAASVV